MELRWSFYFVILYKKYESITWDITHKRPLQIDSISAKVTVKFT